MTDGPAPAAPALDCIGWFIASAHGLLGHDKTAALIGAPAGDRAACVLCAYEANPTEQAQRAVREALQPFGPVIRA